MYKQETGKLQGRSQQDSDDSVLSLPQAGLKVWGNVAIGIKV